MSEPLKEYVWWLAVPSEVGCSAGNLTVTLRNGTTFEARSLGAYFTSPDEFAAEMEAAPELLVALKGLLREWEEERFEWRENRPEVLGLRVQQPNTGSDLIDAARAAIRKAVGE